MEKNILFDRNSFPSKKEEIIEKTNALNKRADTVKPKKITKDIKKVLHELREQYESASKPKE